MFLWLLVGTMIEENKLKATGKTVFEYRDELKWKALFPNFRIIKSVLQGKKPKIREKKHPIQSLTIWMRTWWEKQNMFSWRKSERYFVEDLDYQDTDARDNIKGFQLEKPALCSKKWHINWWNKGKVYFVEGWLWKSRWVKIDSTSWKVRITRNLKLLTKKVKICFTSELFKVLSNTQRKRLRSCAGKLV